MRYIVVESFTGAADTAPHFHVAELVEAAAPLGPRATRYRLLHARALPWEQAQSAVVALNRGEAARAAQIWSAASEP